MKTVTKIADIGEILSKKGQEFTFQDPPLIDAPNTQILKLNGSARQLPDPSKNLSGVMGIERIQFSRLVEDTSRKGTNGEACFTVNSDERVKVVGAAQNAQGAFGVAIGADNQDDYFELTFYGTGLNILLFHDAGGILRDIRATVDGGAEGSNLVIAASSVIDSRNYNPNHVVSVVSGLSLGVHTVKLRAANSNGVFLMGCEFLNESTQIQVPAGEAFYQGRKYSHSALGAIDYNSGFEGAPILNGRGGRVVVYQTPEGQIKKAIQQTDASAGFLSGTDHSTESEVRRINFREFGANRADDFSTLSTVTSDRAFTLDDGTTTLVGDDVQANNSGFWPFVLNGSFTITFVGTGLDIVLYEDATSTADSGEVSVNGSIVGNLPTDGINGRIRNIPICSGLPYGTHTVKVRRSSTGSNFRLVRDFITYGPKKPTIPSDSAELQEYYLMADFVANAVAGVTRSAQGILRKVCVRELIYKEGTGGTSDWAVTLGVTGGVCGQVINGDRGSTFIEYTFFGTGFDFRSDTNTNHSSNISVTLDGTLVTATNFPTASFSTYGGQAFNDSTGILNKNGSTVTGAGFTVSGLPLGLYTVRLTNNTAGSFLTVDGFDVITPIHFPDTKAGSLSMGPGIQLNSETEVGGVDLSKAKAWLQFDGVNNVVADSMNISGVVDRGTGDYDVYFEKPFKRPPILLYTSNTGETLTGAGAEKHKTNIFTRSSAGTNIDVGIIYAVFFGELEDE